MGWPVSGRTTRMRVLPPSAGNAADTHPKINDINTYGEKLDADERTDWLMNNLGMTRAEAENAQETIHYFTGSGFEDMHKNINTEGNDVIDSVIDNPNSPIYAGTQFRGLKIWGSDMKPGVTPRKFLENILKGGIWREAGATSFSASEDIANGFANWNTPSPSYVSVKVEYKSGTTGMPIKHMSRFSYEDEVLHSRKQMTKGYNIDSYSWSPDGRRLRITVIDR